jgi:WD40 repeat protein
MDPETDENNGGKNEKQALVDPESAVQNINLEPRFLFGIKGDVRNNVFFLEDNRVLYPCGHNIIIYHTDEKTQKYIPGIEGSEGISALAISPSKKFLAVAETAERAICCVYDLHTMKRKRIITSAEYQSKSFLSLAFAPSSEKSNLVTLTSEPDMKIIIW